MKSFVKFAIALASYKSVQAASYWDANSCQDVAVTVPSNATSAIVYFVGDDVKTTDNADVYTYEWFTSELSTGAATQQTDGTTFVLKDQDVNNQCGVWAYQFVIIDSSGADVTTAMANAITYTAEADTWKFTIDNTNEDLVANDVYIVALAGLYINPLDGSQSPAFNTQIPIIVMEKIKLLDTSAYGIMVDGYLEMADPFIKQHFFDGSAIFSLITLVFFPMLMTAGQGAMFFLVPAAYWGMAVINLPISIALSSYWAALFVGVSNALAMVSGVENTPVA